MQFNSSTFKSILFSCAIIGVCQSAIWLVLTICAVLTFRCVFRTPQYDTDHIILTTIVKLYFEGEECRVKKNANGYPDISEAKLTTPTEVFSYMIAFMVISSIQFLLSLYLIKCRNGNSVRFILRDWCLITLVVAVMDASLTGIFIKDFIRLEEFLKTNGIKDEKNIVAAPAAMFIFAARGFALWIVNVAFLLYFNAWFSSTTIHSKESTRKSEEIQVDKKKGHENLAFKTSTESLAFQYSGRRDFTTFKPLEDITYNPKKDHRSLSVSSFEAVTPFNEEKYPKIIENNSGKFKREADKVTCNCQKWSHEEQNVSGIGMYNTSYHSHGCSALRLELEEKLSTIRGKNDRMVNKPKKLKDFSHDINNFKRGGQNRTKNLPERRWIPKAPSLPAAATCNDSNFY